ncbi:WbqC family protein [bacterium]|nr:WbqC family protein [bacterium]
MEVADNGWWKKHWASLRQAYRKAPYFSAYEADLQGFYTSPWPDLVDGVSVSVAQLLTPAELFGLFGLPAPCSLKTGA